MSMSTFNFASMAAQITEEQGISFQDKAKTWDSASDVQEVVDALNNQATVNFLNLDGNTLGVEAARAIGEALKRHPEFRKALWKNLFTRRLKAEIPEALQLLGAGLIAAGAKLTVLDLSDNALGPNGMRGLEVFLRSPVCYSLQELHLYNCGLGPEGGAMLSKALIDLHANARKAGTPLQLRVFVGGRNRLEDSGAKALAKAFATLKTLQEIVLLQNSIYLEGVKALAYSFKANPHLRVLNMYDNTVKSKGADEIAEVIKSLTMLREIHFGDCLIGTNGAYQIAEALENSNNDLEVIDLSSNEINSDGGLVLVAAIQNKPKLRVLNIDGNCFGHEGCAQIIEQMSTYGNADALQPFEEDEDENEPEESSEEEEEQEYDDGNDEYDEHEHANDTTEEADEDDDEYAEETAYVTTNAYTTKLFNEWTDSKASDTFAIGNQSPTKSCNPEQFCLSQTPCSLQQFESLDDENNLQALQGIINQFTGDNHLLLLVFTTLKCAHLSQLSQPALELAVSLFQATFDYALKTKQETRVLNYVLKQLGLLRCEETFKTDYDVKSCRHALREALQKPHFANDNIKNTFKLFLDKVDA
ncbi:ran GTPase-activating protein [Drosophila obscura]|uniref:ran GTPase-activating protein n=1 Tax=Drosophila obscura TaxID=7282 RepID=UPI000BA079F7|nr:ran GTPase-activating protein [Drosophila obscura]